MRRIIIGSLIALVTVVVLATAVIASGGESSVTRARLERSLPVTFANLYVEQARILGREGLSPESLGAKAMCDKHGPDVADVGPGGDWVCIMGWTDPEAPLPPEGYGKFELNVHSNGCYTVSGPSKIIGFLTITDPDGAEVTNPVFEFDGCFDPNADNTATGVSYPSLFALTSTSLTPDSDGHVDVKVSCGPGSDGCSGTVSATAGGQALGSMPYSLREQSTGTLTVPQAMPSNAGDLSFQVTSTAGFGPKSPITLAVQEP